MCLILILLKLIFIKKLNTAIYVVISSFTQHYVFKIFTHCHDYFISIQHLLKVIFIDQILLFKFYLTYYTIERLCFCLPLIYWI